MKKILILLVLFTGLKIYGQNNPVDSADWVTTTTNADYGILFNDSPKKMSRMTMQYMLPVTFSGSTTTLRSIAYDMVLGGTTNTWSDKLYVVGTQRTSGNVFNMSRTYFGNGGTAYITGGNSSAPMMFYDAVTGLKSLGQLASGGSGVDLTFMPNGRVFFKMGDTLSYSSSLHYTSNTLKLTSATSDTALSVVNALGSNGIYILNSKSDGNGLSIGNTGASAFGVFSYNSAGGTAFQATNTSTGIGYGLTNTSSGRGGYFYNTSTGTGLEIYNTGTGKAIKISSGYSEVFYILGDSIYYPKVANGSRQWNMITGTGAFIGATLTPAGFMLTMQIPGIKDYMKDVQNGEWAWWYKDKDGIHKVYGLAEIKDPMSQLQAMQAGTEMTVKMIGEQDKRSDDLELKYDKLLLIVIVLAGFITLLLFSNIYLLTKKR